jgi:hypothetical protein
MKIYGKVVTGLLLGTALLVGMASSLQAQSPGSPAGCNANRLNIDIQVDESIVPNGEIARYTVDVVNNPAQNTDACDVETAFVTFCCPQADGQPPADSSSPDCTRIPVTTVFPTDCAVTDGGGIPDCVPTSEADAGINFPADGTNDKVQIGHLTCRINVNPGVTSVTARAQVEAGYLLLQTGGPIDGVVQPALPKLLVLQVQPPTPTPTNTPTNTPTLTPTNTPTLTPTNTLVPTDTPTPTPTSPPVPVVPSPTHPAGLALILGLGLAIAWMMRRAVRSESR